MGEDALVDNIVSLPGANGEIRDVNEDSSNGIREFSDELRHFV